MTFAEALKSGDIDQIRPYPKADLHNHFVLGGSRRFIREKTGIDIAPITRRLHAMKEMDAWSQRNIGQYFNTSERRKLLIEAAFAQAMEDGVTILEIGEDVWGLAEFFHNDVDELIDAFYGARDRFAPQVELRLQIGLSRHCPIDYLQDCLRHFWGHGAFYAIDLYGDESAQPIENFVPIYERAKAEGIVLKAHVGEWGSAGDVVEAVRVLRLDEVQHGIVAAEDEEAIAFLKERNVRLNITPSSNILLGRVAHMGEHPIAKLWQHGVDVTINSDDVLMFDSDVSKEYLRLHQAECLSAEALEQIRVNGLRKNRMTNWRTDGRNAR